MMTLPGINKNRLKKAAESAAERVGQVVEQAGGGDALRKAGEALRGASIAG